jgi:uncharacterized damage-inducible protein DinB
MITRIWHGKTKKEDSNIYRQYVIDSGIKEYQKTKGNLDAQIWQKDENEITHIWTVTRWKDFESIKAFAGGDYQKAKYYPKDEKYLLEFEPNVEHYQSYTFSNTQIKNYIKQINELYYGENWTDESFFKKIENLEAEKAFMQPAPGKHSAAEILWHCMYWRKVDLKRMQGDFEFEKQTEEEQNFLSLEKLKQKGWKNLLAEFKDVQDQLIIFLNSKNDNFLEEECIRNYNKGYLIQGLIFHDYYHLGQIGFVLSFLNKQNGN